MKKFEDLREAWYEADKERLFAAIDVCRRVADYLDLLDASFDTDKALDSVRDALFTFQRVEHAADIAFRDYLDAFPERSDHDA